ncbi:MAG: methyltransferase domain-containing protein [Acidobacteria bacterium]|nr:methyltransferase domain-containing protein [Acidobacteriota bacterium]NIQ30682.1 methyltransferase domain-containing protein [Acidobacteriota bacterium]NIQ85640.1 methyltransferase domain-containing protein [Acidobacteriota bacterium]
MNRGDQQGYVPALGLDFLTRLYDPVVALTTRERHFKKRLLEQASIPTHASVLDLGCGTGTLALEIARTHPTAEVSGLDGDEKMLRMARTKSDAANLRVRFDRGLAQALPYPDASFERVVSTLFFHHLRRRQKSAAAREVFRVLRPGGEFHVADWGRPVDRLMRLLFYPVQLLDGFATTGDNVKGLLPEIFEVAGFRNVRTRGEIRTVLGTLTLYSAAKASP